MTGGSGHRAGDTGPDTGPDPRFSEGPGGREAAGGPRSVRVTTGRDRDRSAQQLDVQPSEVEVTDRGEQFVK